MSAGRKKVHRHGGYYRNRRAEGSERVWIEQFLCVRCGQTFTVIPDDMLPYRPLEGSRTQAWFDAHYGMSATRPVVREKEKGCLRRALCKFAEHTPSLIQKLGQMIPRPGQNTRRLWYTVRQLGGLAEILRWLAEKFKTSLLGDYRCLHRSMPLSGVYNSS